MKKINIDKVLATILIVASFCLVVNTVLMAFLSK